MRSRKKRKKIIIGAIAAVVTLAVIGVGAAFAYMGVLNGKLSKGIDEDTQLALTDKSLAEPFYMLLMGTDKVANMETAIEATRPCWRALIPFRKR